MTGELVGVPGGRELALLATRYYASVKEQTAAGKVAFIAGYPVSARSLLAVARTASVRIAAGHEPVEELVGGLKRAYSGSVQRSEQSEVVLLLLRMAVAAKDLRKASYTVVKRGAAHEDDGFKEIISTVSAEMAALEQRLAGAVWTAVLSASGTVNAQATLAQQVRILWRKTTLQRLRVVKVCQLMHYISTRAHQKHQELGGACSTRSSPQLACRLWHSSCPRCFPSALRSWTRWLPRSRARSWQTIPPC